MQYNETCVDGTSDGTAHANLVIPEEDAKYVSFILKTGELSKIFIILPNRSTKMKYF